ncbi:MAG TPA: enterotoxin [Terriglobales bacterium]|nr:enterotoxin [Terriglobales bacterium]
MVNRRQFVQQTGGLIAGAMAAPAWLSGTIKPPRLSNGLIAADWDTSAGGLRLAAVRDLATGRTLRGAGPVVSLVIGGAVIASTQLRLSDVRSSPLPVDHASSNFAERLPGRRLTARLEDPERRFRIEWRALLRDGSHYLRQEVAITALTRDLALDEVRMIDCAAEGIAVRGSVKGSPVVTPDEWFMGFEHPLSTSTVADGRAVCVLPRPLPLRAGLTAAYSSVIGAAPTGQMRRSFLAYIERERAHPYRPFLHYNSWFDLGYFTPYDETGCLDVIKAFGQELHARRGVVLDSFLFDDGWDNHRDWGFNAGFPHGFTPLKAATAAIGAAPGVWLSPWGGYGNPRKERLANAGAEGYEVNREGLALSGPRYYKQFHRVCLKMVRDYGINQFKLDGTGSTAEVVPGSAFGSDFEAAIQLIADLRVAKPDLFINLTTGTYPSPFWLRHADSTWRGGSDTDFAGVGTDRQMWMTYRDGDTYKRVVQRGPLYPLNSLMLHGLVFAKHARRLDTDPGNDFTSDARAYFGSGTQLQEMYISHDLMSNDNWDALAQAARWARRSQATLVDSHWVGGDPLQLQAYGHAAWSPRQAILTLRNPSDKPQTLELDPAEAFELPADAHPAFTVRSPWKDDAEPLLTLTAGERHSFELQPFEVLTLESAQVNGR